MMSRKEFGIVIENENDVRKAFKDDFARDRLFWVEQASGSTFGVPDLIVPMGLEIGEGSDRWCRSFPFLIELKVGEIVDEKLKFTLRPAQARFMRMAEMINMPVLVAIGQKGTNWIYFARNSENVRQGFVDLDWWTGDPFLSCETTKKGAVESAVKGMWKIVTGGWPG